MTTLRDGALALAANGFRVFPLVPGGKTPALETDWRKLAASDQAAVYDLWTDPVTGWDQPYNIGIALDADTLVVDVDVRENKKGRENLKLLEAIYDPLPATYRVRTSSRGDHHYFRVDGKEQFASKLADHVDLKTIGGFVVGPGSVINGRRYAVVDDVDPALMRPFPEAWLPIARRAPRETVPAGGIALDETDDAGAIKRAIDWLRTSAPDHGTFVVAAKVKDFGISEELCLDLLMKHWVEEKSLGKSLEHVAFRVGNAYRYGQNPVGISAPEAEFEPEEVVDRRTITTPLPVRNVTSIEWASHQNYLIKGLLNFGMIGFITGMPNAGKSPLALDIAAHVAAGKEWQLRRVVPSYVLYLSTEGWTGIGNRMEALRRTHFANADTVPLDYMARSINLRTTSKDADAIVETAKARAAVFGVKPGLIIIDTFSHTLAGGDESNQEHIRAAIANLKRIVDRTGAAVMVVHHPTKAGTSDSRGSSLLTFDTDLLIKVEIDGKSKLRRVTTPRVKEYAEIAPLAFQIRVVELGTDQDGDKVTSIVVEWRAVAADEFAADRLTQSEEAVLEALKRLQSRGENATFSAWWAECDTTESVGLTNEPNNRLSKATFKRARAHLAELDLIGKTEDDQYFSKTGLKGS